jgi:hypothetical protein
MLGIAKLLYIYGGMLCPLSFVCLKDLSELYKKGTRGDKMFLCEMIDRNSTSLDMDFFPNLNFYGAPKECESVLALTHYIQQIISTDYTSESRFLGDFARWCKQRIEQGQINLIDGTEIGVKSIEGKQIVIDDLMSNHYLKICPDAYGIVIPSEEILNRRKFEWFACLSEKQVLQSDTIIGNYLLIAVAPNDQPGILEPLEPAINKQVENEFVGFWKVPLDAPVWSLKPNFLGDNMQKLEYPGR